MAATKPRMALEAARAKVRAAKAEMHAEFGIRGVTPPEHPHSTPSARLGRGPNHANQQPDATVEPAEARTAPEEPPNAPLETNGSVQVGSTLQSQCDPLVVRQAQELVRLRLHLTEETARRVAAEQAITALNQQQQQQQQQQQDRAADLELATLRAQVWALSADLAAAESRVQEQSQELSALQEQLSQAGDIHSSEAELRAAELSCLADQHSSLKQESQAADLAHAQEVSALKAQLAAQSAQQEPAEQPPHDPKTSTQEAPRGGGAGRSASTSPKARRRSRDIFQRSKTSLRPGEMPQQPSRANSCEGLSEEAHKLATMLFSAMLQEPALHVPRSQIVAVLGGWDNGECDQIDTNGDGKVCLQQWFDFLSRKNANAFSSSALVPYLETLLRNATRLRMLQVGAHEQGQLRGQLDALGMLLEMDAVEPATDLAGSLWGPDQTALTFEAKMHRRTTNARGWSVPVGYAVFIKRFQGPEAGHAFAREVRSWVRVGACKQLVRVIGVVWEQDKDVYAIVMEKGTTLDMVLQNKESREPKQLLSYSCDIASALVHLHSTSPPTVHNDMKPQNCVVNTDDVCKLIDLGSAVAPGEPSLFVGTLGYTSPRRATRESPGCCIDIFALGVLLGELLKHTEFEQRALLLVEQCCVPERAARPTAVQVLERLEAFRAETP